MDTISADNLNGDGYKALSEYMIRSGDILVISELDRLGRGSEAIRNEWKRLYDNKIDLAIVNSPILSTINKNEEEKIKINEIVVELLSYLSEKEKKRNKERQAEGINRFESVGHPVCFSEVKIVDENDPEKTLPKYEQGEIALRGPAIAKGYWGNEEKTKSTLTPTGWFLTGDVGYLDDDNRLFITDRKKDMIVMSGWKIRRYVNYSKCIKGRI